MSSTMNTTNQETLDELLKLRKALTKIEKDSSQSHDTNANLRRTIDICNTNLKTCRQNTRILHPSIKKFTDHTETIQNQCPDIKEASLPEKTLKAIKACVSQNPYYAHRCVKSVLKDICITIKAKSKLDGPENPWYHDLDKTYIPFPNPNILEQFQKHKIQIDLFTECFDSYVTERAWSKFFAPDCYINFKDYQVLLGNYTDSQTLLDSYG